MKYQVFKKKQLWDRGFPSKTDLCKLCVCGTSIACTTYGSILNAWEEGSGSISRYRGYHFSPLRCLRPCSFHGLARDACADNLCAYVLKRAVCLVLLHMFLGVRSILILWKAIFDTRRVSMSENSEDTTRYMWALPVGLHCWPWLARAQAVYQYKKGSVR